MVRDVGGGEAALGGSMEPGLNTVLLIKQWREREGMKSAMCSKLQKWVNWTQNDQ